MTTPSLVDVSRSYEENEKILRAEIDRLLSEVDRWKSHWEAEYDAHQRTVALYERILNETDR